MLLNLHSTKVLWPTMTEVLTRWFGAAWSDIKKTKFPAVWKCRNGLSTLWPLASGCDERIISARAVPLRQRPPPQAHTPAFCSVLLAQLAHSAAYWGPWAAVETHPEAFSSSAWNILYRCWCAIKTQHSITSIRQLQVHCKLKLSKWLFKINKKMYYYFPILIFGF